jgi:hypothetical protein
MYRIETDVVVYRLDRTLISYHRLLNSNDTY